MNCCAFVGRLTADPELKTTNGGVSVCSFSLAVKRPHVKDTTDFPYFVAWRQNAEYLCKYGRKGSTVELTGALISLEYEDKDGNKRKVLEVSVDNLRVSSSASNDGAKQQNNAALDSFTANAVAQGVEFEEIVGGDDLPF